MGRFVESLADYCERIICFFHAPCSTEKRFLDYGVARRNISLVNIGTHAPVPVRLLLQKRQLAVLLARKEEFDVLLVRGPTPYLPALAGHRGAFPVILLLVGDYREAAVDLAQAWWRKRLIRLWTGYNHAKQMVAAAQCLTFVNSRKLYREMHATLPDLVEVRTSTIRRDELYEREDTCRHRVCRLLYTGRMTGAKGVLDMIRAVAILHRRGHAVYLDLVGKPERHDDVLAEMDRLVKETDLAQYVDYKGYCTMGPDLWKHYQQSDIYVIASRTSFEGFPRSIWEAMAHCVPVVATNVGSIPYYLSHGENALLVAPKAPAELAAAIETYMRDGRLRKKVIANAFALAKENTLERTSGDLMRKIHAWIAGRT